ncbi:hypothetical protein ABC347_11375 [Sphingomonas sp. 1P06PA]|uniref:hypothetical protein n=1 Tax=Sphingomonas sp. 1P06PA TaxID=554121 RepID=UPI0039A49014
MRFHGFQAALLVFAAPAPTALPAQPAPLPGAAAPYQIGYADLVDLAIAAPIVAAGEIRGAERLKGEAVASLPAGQARFYATADILTLIRGAQGLPPRVSFLVDRPLDARGRAPKLRKQRVILLARPVAGRPADIQLAGPRAMLDWTPETEQRLRAIVTALVSADAPPVITGVGGAFHVRGSLPGESETQIFLTTADSRPVSLSILRRPGEQPRWAVALAEMVDEAAGPPARDTLLWYRLACALPAELPATSIAELEPAAADAARADYRVVIDGLGPCGRSK